MRRCVGLTEFVWASLPEERKILWKYFFRCVSIAGAFFVTKTENIYFDLFLGFFTAAFLIIVIETQRSYSRLSPNFRKKNIRIAIFLGSWGVATLGFAFFLQAAFTATITVFYSDVLPAFYRSQNELTPIVTFLVFLVAAPIACIRIFRQLNFKEFIYTNPRNGLKKLLIYKNPKATSFFMFAYMELFTLIVCLIYSSSVAVITKVFLELKIFSGGNVG